MEPTQTLTITSRDATIHMEPFHLEKIEVALREPHPVRILQLHCLLFDCESSITVDFAKRGTDHEAHESLLPLWDSRQFPLEVEGLEGQDQLILHYHSLPKPEHIISPDEIQADLRRGAEERAVRRSKALAVSGTGVGRIRPWEDIPASAIPNLPKA